MIVTFTDRENVFHALNFDHLQSINCDKFSIQICNKDGRYVIYSVTKEESQKVQDFFSKKS